MPYHHVLRIDNGRTLYPTGWANGRSPSRARELGGKGTVTGIAITSGEARTEAVKACVAARRREANYRTAQAGELSCRECFRIAKPTEPGQRCRCYCPPKFGKIVSKDFTCDSAERKP